MNEENETIGQWKTLGGADTGRIARAERGAEETIGEMETIRGEGGVVLGRRYRVVRRLGEGGMGSVWLAEDTKLDGKLFAIKMLPSMLAGKKGAYRQVKAEAAVAMKLSHPNIATVRAFEEDEAGNPFLVMDYIEGEGLDDILAEKGALGEEETLRILGPVAAALDYAHSQGVVHRDVKPGNVMLRKDGTPFVLDFGIAREIQETLTRVTGKLSSGTLLYMSPEQLHGRSPKASQDVYSFAAMAYECLAGKPPFSRGQIEWQIDHDTPEPLAEGVASQVLRAGVMAGLAKEPEGRPGSCAGVLGWKVEGRTSNVEGRRSQVESHGSNVEGHRSNVEGRRGKADGGRSGGWGWVATALVAAGVGLGVWQWQGTDAGKTPAPRQDIAGEPPSPPGAEGTERLAPRRASSGGVFSLDLGGGVTLEMVHCPGVAGDFWMGKTEVTQEQWQRVTGETPSYFAGKPKNPVENVSWNDCQEFVKKVNALPAARASGLTFRLPTEEEWETACRAGAPKAADYCKLADGTQITEATLGKVARFGKGWNDGPVAVGSFLPNAWGLHDMHGNVWEWTQTAVGDGRVNRGGSFLGSAGFCSAGGQYRGPPDGGSMCHGLRLAASGRAATR